MNTNVETAMTHCTVRIETPETEKTGSGFFYQIDFGGANAFTKLYITTNEHVIEGAKFIRYVLTTDSDVKQVDECGIFLDETHHTIETRLSKTVHFGLGISYDTVIPHPNP